VCARKFLVADVRSEAIILGMQGEKHWLHFHTAWERSSLLLLLCLEKGETVLDPGLRGEGVERERNLLFAGRAGDQSGAVGAARHQVLLSKGGRKGRDRVTADGEPAAIFTETLHSWWDGSW